MDREALSRLVLAEAMQRHDELVVIANARVTTLRNELDVAQNQMLRTLQARAAFRDLVRRSQENPNA